MDLEASEAAVDSQSADVNFIAKKMRLSEEMNKVAEIVLVLSAMGTMRGGRNPTEVELELMTEARSKLVEMCQEFTPKDIVDEDAIGAVIEDLDLNSKLKDQRLGFRAPRLTISEKLSLGKRKMEEAKKYPATSTSTGTPHISQQPGGTASMAVSTLGSATHTVRVIDRTNHQTHPTGAVMGSSPYVAAGSNASMAHQWPSNEFKISTASTPTVGSHYVRDTSGLAQSRVERPHMKPESLGGAAQGSATSSANYWNASTWSAQPQSAFTVTTATDIQGSGRASDQSYRSYMPQASPGTFPVPNQPMQGMNYGQALSFGNNHVEIAKIIHKVLHPRVQQNPTWTPPSREYMNKAMACQICQATVNEIDTVLICDACDKGYHLKCLQANNLKGVPKSEWHCSRCVQLYQGKSFPIKYGRVMRSSNMQKVPSSTVGLQLPTEEKAVNQPKAAVTTNPASVTASVNANTTSKNAMTTTPSSIKNNGLLSKAPPAAGSASTAPVSNLLPASTATTVGLGSVGPTVAGNENAPTSTVVAEAAVLSPSKVHLETPIAESSKNVIDEKEESETLEDHPTKSPDTHPCPNSKNQMDKTVSNERDDVQPQTDIPNTQEARQNNMKTMDGDKSSNGSNERDPLQAAETEEDNS